MLAAGGAAAADVPAIGGNGGHALHRASASVPRDAPGEILAPGTDEDYLEYRQMTDMREPYRWVTRCSGGGAAVGCLVGRQADGVPLLSVCLLCPLGGHGWWRSGGATTCCAL